MKDLLFDMKELTRRNGEGSEWTRAVRHRSLQAMGRELDGLGFRSKSPANIKPKHVSALVGAWRAQGLAGATVRNRLGHLRWLASKVGKPGLLPNSNETFGLEPRTPYKGRKALPLDRERLAKIPDERIRLALRLQQAFGLRREEAIKFRVTFADRGDYLALKPSWTKGGRYREIPITDQRQRALLEEVRAAVGDGSLIPDGKTFHEQRKAYDNETLRVGLRNNHRLRHWYACWRYWRLSGEAPPAYGGRTCDGMTEAERRRDYFIRLQVSRELGHSRVDVTATYLAPALGAEGRPGGMTSPRQPFRPALVQATREAREALAAEIYASAAVKLLLSQEAGKGLSSAVITTKLAIDLRDTEAAQALVAWLRKEGLRPDWTRRTDPLKAHAIMGDFWDLVVSWEKPSEAAVR